MKNATMNGEEMMVEFLVANPGNATGIQEGLAEEGLIHLMVEGDVQTGCIFEDLEGDKDGIDTLRLAYGDGGDTIVEFTV